MEPTRAIVVKDGKVVNAILVNPEKMIELDGCEIIITDDYDIGEAYPAPESE